MDVGEFGEKTRSYVTDYIKFGDAKAGSIVALVGLIGGVLGASAKTLLATMAGSGWPLETFGALVGAAVAVSGVMCLWYSVDALAPRTPSAEKSLASFPDIATYTAKEYVERIAALDASGIAAEYARVNSTLAWIAKAKFDSIGKAMWWLRGLLLSTYLLVLTYAVLCIKSGGR
jgi:hypothetical protein